MLIPLGVISSLYDKPTPYWINLLSDYKYGSYTNTRARSLAIDSKDNTVIAGISYYGTDGLLAKFNKNGEIQIKKSLTTGGNYDLANVVHVDSSDNIYTAGRYSRPGTGGMVHVGIVKQDKNGTILWQKNLYQVNSTSDIAKAITTDSAGNVYLYYKASGNQYSANNGKNTIVVSLNGSGTIRWQTILETTANSGEQGEWFGPVDISVNDDFDLFIATSETGGSNSYGVIWRMDSYSGGVSAKVDIERSSGQPGVSFSSVVESSTDGSEFVAIGNDNEPVIAKYSFTTPGILWQRKLVVDAEAKRVAMDSLGNIYTLFYNSSQGFFVVTKHSASGSLLWQRKISSSQSLYYGDIDIDSNDIIKIAGGVMNHPNSRSFLLSLPNDGSLTGTYVVDDVTIIYAASTYTESAANMVTASPKSLSTSAASLSTWTSNILATSSTAPNRNKTIEV